MTSGSPTSAFPGATSPGSQPPVISPPVPAVTPSTPAVQNTPTTPIMPGLPPSQPFGKVSAMTKRQKTTVRFVADDGVSPPYAFSLCVYTVPIVQEERGKEESRHHHTHYLCHHGQQQRIAQPSLRKQASQSGTEEREHRASHQTTEKGLGRRRSGSARRQTRPAHGAPQTLRHHPERNAVQEARCIRLAILQAR